MNTRGLLAQLARNMTMSGGEATITDEKSGSVFEAACRNANFTRDSLERSIKICSDFLKTAVSSGMKVVAGSDEKQLTNIDSNCVVNLHSDIRNINYNGDYDYNNRKWAVTPSNMRYIMQQAENQCRAYLDSDFAEANPNYALKVLLVIFLVMLLLFSIGGLIVYLCNRTPDEERRPLLANAQNRQPYNGMGYRLGVDAAGGGQVAVVVQQRQGEQQEGEREPGQLAP